MDRDDRRGLGEVRVDKQKLIAKIEDNLAQHRADYEVGLAGWEEETLRLADEIQGAREKSDPIAVNKLAWKIAQLPKPESHESDYRRTLEKLNASEDVQFVLDDHSFAQYWCDDWRWKAGFSSSVSNYKKG